MSPLCASEAKVRSQDAKFVLRKVSHKKENSLSQVLGGQGMGMVLGSEQMSGGEGGCSCKAGYRISARDSWGVERS